tara:strand:+ start:5999 stop:6559 length:561 start_codon:yes stop_codon:yes gene_type:complete
MQKLSSPIPGANYTTDTRNYSWHRPPDIVDYDEAVEYFITKMDEPYENDLVMSLIDLETPITVITASLMLQSISKGKIPIDLAILIAGPVARYIEILAKSENKTYEMGASDKDRVSITPTSLKIALGLVDDATSAPEIVERTLDEPPEGGLMAMPEEPVVASENEQQSMLGMDEGSVEEEQADGMA